MVMGLDALIARGVRDKRVFVRVDLNVPLRDGVITDDTRVRASLPTLQRLLRAGARVVIASHLGRPKGKRKPELSLRPLAPRLAQLLGTGVSFCEDCIGPVASRAVSELGPGQAVLLENLRFHAGEEGNDADFAKALAELADCYVNDAFGTAHRAHASTAGITRHVATVAAGELLQSELDHLLAVLEALAPHADALLIGGAMAYTFLAARGERVGASLVEPDRFEDARRVIQ